MSDDPSFTPRVPTSDQSAAADLIRSKLAHMYEEEPEAKLEIKEVIVAGAHSKHQRFIDELQKSGKNVVEIQTAWHEYYNSLDDDGKHEVWREFNTHLSDTHKKQKEAPQEPKPEQAAEETPVSVAEVNNYYLYKAQHRNHFDANAARTIPQEAEQSLPELKRHVGDAKHEKTRAIKHKIIKTVSADGKLKTSHHVKSLVFAMAFAGIVTAGLFFVTNNEKFIAPFIVPSKNASAAPIIADGITISQEAKIIIPKLNLEAPLALEAKSNDEADIQAELEKGVVLYPNTGLPGEQSNPIFFGHSSNNLFNNGSYKFVFVRLSQLEIGDTYAINFRGTQYVYKIFARDVVRPTQVEVLSEKPRPAMTTLITCDPPGTSDYRLIIRGEQISPSPDANTASTAITEPGGITKIPSNAPSLIQRLFGR